ncbi:MAG: SDR family oxidoreductase [Ruminiclostridium sp.]|nr:SDR family oxidoreductase [Ruminiclostridium sp.]
MGSPYGKVVLVTGASSGIGRSIAELLKAKGYRVYGTSRKPENESRNAVVGGSGFIRMLLMDVCSEESVKNAISQILEAEGTIDIVVNNAGMGIAGSVEDTSPEEVYRQINTNFFGAHRVIRQVAPIMRKNRNGLIVNISSVAAQFPIPFQSMYCASKTAIEAMSEALRTELKPFGVKVSMIEPGDIKTGFTDSRVFTADSGENSVYRDNFKKSVGVMIKDETNGPDPIVVAKQLYRIIGKRNPPIRVIIGLQYKVFVFLKRLLPDRLVSFVISKMY